LGDTLQLGPRATALRESSPLLGALPELDSMAVVNVIGELENRYGFVVDDDEVNGDVFSTVGSLHEFVQRKMSE
jgi:acyl carrier protein